MSQPEEQGVVTVVTPSWLDNDGDNQDVEASAIEPAVVSSAEAETEIEAAAPQSEEGDDPWGDSDSDGEGNPFASAKVSSSPAPAAAAAPATTASVSFPSPQAVPHDDNPSAEASAFESPLSKADADIFKDVATPVVASNAAEDNPFGDDSEDDDRASAPLVATSAIAMTTAATTASTGSTVASDNPFGDSDSEDDEAIAVATARPVSHPSSQQQPAKPQWAVKASPAAAAGGGEKAGLSAEMKTALQALMLAGVPQRYAMFVLNNQVAAREAKEDTSAPGLGLGLDLRAAFKTLRFDLQKRPECSDRQIWEPTLSAKVGSWLPETSDGNAFTVYTVTVALTVPAYRTWRVCKRFRTFKDALARITKVLPTGSTKVVLDVPFPAHGYFEFDTDARKDARRQGLDKWLKALLACGPAILSPAVLAVLWDLLDVEANKATGRAVEKEEKVARGADGRALRKPSIR
jgi:hypothetical protein